MVMIRDGPDSIKLAGYYLAVVLRRLLNLISGRVPDSWPIIRLDTDIKGRISSPSLVMISLLFNLIPDIFLNSLNQKLWTWIPIFWKNDLTFNRDGAEFLSSQKKISNPGSQPDPDHIQTLTRKNIGCMTNCCVCF